MPRYKISTASDCTLANPGCMTVHGCWVPPAPPVVAPCFETPWPMFGTAAGTALGQHALTKRTLHSGRAIVQDGHDVGMGLIHVSAPPTNVLTPLHILFSKRAVTFFETRVRFERGYAAACTMSWPPTPMLACADPISLPTAFALSGSNTVTFGMSWANYVTSVAMVTAEMCLDVVLHTVTAKPLAKLAGPRGEVPWQGTKKLMTEVLRDSLSRLLPKLGLNATIGAGKFAMGSGPRKTSVSGGLDPFNRVSFETADNGDTIVGYQVLGVGARKGLETPIEGTQTLSDVATWSRFGEAT